MATHQIGRIVTASLVGGLVAAPALVLGPVAGAQEHVIFAGRYPEHVAGMVLLDGRDAQVGWLPLQDRMATLSTKQQPPRCAPYA